MDGTPSILIFHPCINKLVVVKVTRKEKNQISTFNRDFSTSCGSFAFEKKEIISKQKGNLALPKLLVTLVEKGHQLIWRVVYCPSMLQCMFRGCTLCKISKPWNQMLGLYTPWPTPFRPWESISMDFLGGFSRTRNWMNIFSWWWIDSIICVLIFVRKPSMPKREMKNSFIASFWFSQIHYFR